LPVRGEQVTDAAGLAGRALVRPTVTMIIGLTRLSLQPGPRTETNPASSPTTSRISPESDSIKPTRMPVLAGIDGAKPTASRPSAADAAANKKAANVSGARSA
jgi:hypothetical protein